MKKSLKKGGCRDCYGSVWSGSGGGGSLCNELVKIEKATRL